MLDGSADVANSEPVHDDRLEPQPTQEPLSSAQGFENVGAQVQDASLDSQQDGFKARRGRRKAEPASTTSSQPCRFFGQHGHCRYGERCLFSHDVSERKDAAQHERPTEVCRFYERTGYCRFGRGCRYAHGPRSKAKNARRVDKAALNRQPKQVVDSNTPQGPAIHPPVEDVMPKDADLLVCAQPNEVIDPKCPVDTPSTHLPTENVSSPNLGDQAPKRELTEEEAMKELRAREIEQFRRRYRRCRKLPADEENADKFSFVFQPTDRKSVV